MSSPDVEDAERSIRTYLCTAEAGVLFPADEVEEIFQMGLSRVLYIPHMCWACANNILGRY
jgi:hypothetical protein